MRKQEVRAAIEQRLLFWQRQLTFMGVAHFRIEEVKVNNAPGGNPRSHACVSTSKAYDSVWFEFSREFVEKYLGSDPEGLLDQTVIHEWVHVAFRDYYFAITCLDNKLNDAEQATWDERLEFENEKLIERLARQIHSAFMSDVVLWSPMTERNADVRP